MTASCSPTVLPYAHLNLRRNPFGELSIDDWAALATVEIEDFVRLLHKPRTVVQFVGDKGHGKTTHLLAIRSRFPGSGYVHIPEGERREIPVGSPVLIDEAQRLRWSQRRQLFRSAQPLVLGTHYDFTSALRRAGRAVTTVEVSQETTASRVHQLLNNRIANVRRGDGAVPEVTQETAGRLMSRFGPNIRRILHEMYVTFQNLPEGQHVQV